jgi:hypothetical protein
MSAELITENIEDKDGVSATLKMNVRGFAFLTLCGNEVGVNDGNVSMTSFALEPNEKGIYDAETIIEVLQEWLKHTRETK